MGHESVHLAELKWLFVNSAPFVYLLSLGTESFENSSICEGFEYCFCRPRTEFSYRNSSSGSTSRTSDSGCMGIISSTELSAGLLESKWLFEPLPTIGLLGCDSCPYCRGAMITMNPSLGPAAEVGTLFYPTDIIIGVLKTFGCILFNTALALLA